MLVWVCGSLTVSRYDASKGKISGNYSTTCHLLRWSRSFDGKWRATVRAQSLVDCGHLSRWKCCDADLCCCWLLQSVSVKFVSFCCTRPLALSYRWNGWQVNRKRFTIRRIVSVSVLSASVNLTWTQKSSGAVVKLLWGAIIRKSSLTRSSAMSISARANITPRSWPSPHRPKSCIQVLPQFIALKLIIRLGSTWSQIKAHYLFCFMCNF